MQINVYLADLNEVRCVLFPTCSCRWRHDQRIWKGLYIHDPFAFQYVSFQMYQFTCKFLYIKLSTYRVSDVWNSGPAGSSCWRIMTMVYTYLWCFKSNDTSMSWRTVHVLVYVHVLLIKKRLEQFLDVSEIHVIRTGSNVNLRKEPAPRQITFNKQDMKTNSF